MPDNPTSTVWNYVQELLDKIKTLTKENAELRSKLQQYQHTKTSLNSSIPPSKDSLATQCGKVAKLRMACGLRLNQTRQAVDNPETENQAESHRHVQT